MPLWKVPFQPSCKPPLGTGILKAGKALCDVKSNHWLTEGCNSALPQNFCVFRPFLPPPESKEQRGWGATGLHPTIFNPWWMQISSNLLRAGEGAAHSSRIRSEEAFTHIQACQSSFGSLSWSPRSEQDALHFKHSLDLNHYLFEWINNTKIGNSE